MPGGRDNSSVFPGVKPRRRDAPAGSSWAAAPEPWRLPARLAPRDRSPTPRPRRPLTPLRSPALWVLGSQIPAIRLRHLLAQSDTHGAFSGALPGRRRHGWPGHGVSKACHRGTQGARPPVWAPAADTAMTSPTGWSLHLLPPVQTVTGHQEAPLCTGCTVYTCTQGRPVVEELLRSFTSMHHNVKSLCCK